MGNFDSVFIAEYQTESVVNNSTAPTQAEKRDVWTGFETIREPTTTVIAGTNVVRVFRGVIGGTFVFNNGSPPVGATDIVIVAEIVG